MESIRTPNTPAHAWNIFGTSPIPTLVVHLHSGLIVDANDAGGALLGSDRGQLRDRALGEYVVRGAADLLMPTPPRCSLRCKLSTTVEPREAVLIDIPHADEYRAIMFLGNPAPTPPEELDPLTGLATREALPSAVAAATELRGTRAGIAFIDLDGFKAVNDQYGHLRGDAVLIGAARAIQRVCRDTDTAIRFGGDEFVVVLPRIRTREQAIQLGDRIRREVTAATASLGHRLSASVGVALFDDDADGTNITFTGVHAADVAMYEAKRAGGDQTIVHAVRSPRGLTL